MVCAWLRRLIPDRNVRPVGLRDMTMQWGLMIKETVRAWLDDYAPSMGAAIAYYTAFSIAPLLLIVIAIAGIVLGETPVREQLVAQLSLLVGNVGAQAIRQLLVSAANPAHSGPAALLGTGALLLGATSVFAELQSALNRIWKVRPATQPGGLWPFIRVCLLCVGIPLGTSFLLAVSLTLSAALHALSIWWAPLFGKWTLILEIVNGAVGFGLGTVLFALIYRVMPNARIRWSDVGFGAVVTAVLFEVGKQLIGLYLGTSAMLSTFGAAGSFVVLLVWVYYSVQVFLLGAEFTWVYSQHAGLRRSRS
jgi:membrane protein